MGRERSRQPRVVEAEASLDVDDGVDDTALVPAVASVEHPPWYRNLLRKETVPMTVLAQDPDVADERGVVRVQVPVPAGRLQRGPRSHRLHVVDVAVGTNRTHPTVRLHQEGDPWSFDDAWTVEAHAADDLVGEREFRAQNVFAVASHTLALFEGHLGRRIPWRSGFPQLYLVPDAVIAGNAHYSPDHAAVLFGFLPSVGDLPAVHTSLSYDVVAHEVSHAILDGLKPRYTEPGLPDQLAFHEALADLVALFSVFGLPGVAERLLDTDGDGRIRLASDALASNGELKGEMADDAATAARLEGRAAFLRASPLAGLAEQLGRRNLRRDGFDKVKAGSVALRRSVDLESTTTWRDDPTYGTPHRRAEILVAAFMQTFVRMWAGRLEALSTEGGMDAARVAEEGTKAAEHLLGMLLRSLDYLPPVELEFADVIDAVITSDLRLAPDDERDYRGALQASFREFAIVPPKHQIVDEDGVAAPVPWDEELAADAERLAGYDPDPDASELGIRYQHLNFAALRTSPEEVYEFIWSNSSALGIDVRFTTQVERVIASTRVGPDGLVVQEVLAEYTQRLRTTAGNLPPGMVRPEAMEPDAVVEMWGGGVLVFDQFGRYRLHQRKPLLDVGRQQVRLDHLFQQGLRDRDGGYGTNDGVRASQRFALLHPGSSEVTW